MTAFQWFQLIQTVLMAVAAIIVGMLLRGFSAGKWIQKSEDKHETVMSKIRDIEERADKESTILKEWRDKVGREMSVFSTKVQAIPETLRIIFLPREVFDVVDRQNSEDREKLHEEVEKLWQAVRQIQQGPRHDGIGPRGGRG